MTRIIVTLKNKKIALELLLVAQPCWNVEFQFLAAHLGGTTDGSGTHAELG